MAQVGIETAQNVVLDHEVASVGDRIVAYLIDGLVLFAWVFFWFFLFALFSFGGMGARSGIFMFVIVLLPYLFYHLVCELTMDGQSVGKRARKIKVARIDGGQPTLGQYLLRWVLRPIDSFYGIGLVVLLINGKGQRIGDLAAGTNVITLKRRLRLQDTLLAEVPADHVVRFPEAIRLTDGQAAMIKEVLNEVAKNGHWTLVSDLAERVRGILGIRGEGLRDMEFLQAVLRDHVHLTTSTGTGQGGEPSDGGPFSGRMS